MSELSPPKGGSLSERSVSPLQCTCPSWMYRGYCKHADKALALIKSGYPLKLPSKAESETRPGTYYTITDASAPPPEPTGQAAVPDPRNPAVQEPEKRGRTHAEDGIPIPPTSELAAVGPNPNEPPSPSTTHAKPRQATLEAPG